MSTEEIKICKCDYCGYILTDKTDYIHIYAGDNHWLHFDHICAGILKNETSIYELDFCSPKHMAAWITEELMSEL
jgi:hypothetical protein